MKSNTASSNAVSVSLAFLSFAILSCSSSKPVLTPIPKDTLNSIKTAAIDGTVIFENDEFQIAMPSGPAPGLLNAVVYSATEKARQTSKAAMQQAMNSKARRIIPSVLVNEFKNKIKNRGPFELVDTSNSPDGFFQIVVNEYGFKLFPGFVGMLVSVKINLIRVNDGSIVWYENIELTREEYEENDIIQESGLNLTNIQEEMVEEFTKNPMLLEETYSKIASLLSGKIIDGMNNQ